MDQIVRQIKEIVRSVTNHGRRIRRLETLQTPITLSRPLGGHIIQDEGDSLPDQVYLDFVGNGVTASDDPTNGKTIINIPGIEAALIELDKIILIKANGFGFALYEPIQEELELALNASGSGDLIWLPPCTLSGDITIPAGVGLASMGNNAVIDGKITLAGNNSQLLGIVINYSDSSAGELVGVDCANSAGTVYINDCGITVTNSGAGDAIGIKGTGAGAFWSWNCHTYGNATGGGDGYGIQPGAGNGFVEGGWLLGSTSPINVTGTGYVAGAEISSDAITVTSSSGALVSGLSIGTWYAIEAYNGSWISGASGVGAPTSLSPPTNWCFKVSNDGGSTWSGQMGQGYSDDGVNSVFRSDMPAWGSYLEQVATYYARMFFLATTTSIRICVGDWQPGGPWGDNSGTLSWRLRAVDSIAPIVTNAVRMDPVVGEPTLGDKGVWDVENYSARHANDINDDALLRHLPAPGTNGNIAQDDGTNWISTSLSDALGSSVDIVASENLTAGNLVDIWNDGGTAKVRKADTSNGYLADGFVLANVTSGNTATVYLLGKLTGLSSMTPGAKQFLSTSGARTETAPSTSGYIIQEVGIALSATIMKFEPQQIILLN